MRGYCVLMFWNCFGMLPRPIKGYVCSLCRPGQFLRMFLRPVNSCHIIKNNKGVPLCESSTLLLS